MDVEDLKREFDRYRAGHPELLAAGAILEGPGIEVPVEEEMQALVADDGGGESIEFRPGMTMAEMECEAIISTLKSVAGNRRKAAERLQIGERTLYRKLKEYDIDV